MKTDLNVIERLTVMDLLPKEGSFVTLKLIRNLLEKIGFTGEELVEYELKQEGNLASWNIEKGKVGKPFEFGKKEEEVIASSLRKLDEEKKLEQRHVSLFEKFIGGE